MKKIALLSLMCLAIVSISFAQASGTSKKFEPVRANVGGFGWNSQLGTSAEPFFWVFSSNGTEFCLGPCNDEKAKAMYATVLTAISTGQSIEIAYWADPPIDVNVSNAKIWTYPNYVSLVK